MENRTCSLVLFSALYLAAASSGDEQAQEPLILGSGDHTYEWVRGWGTFPEGRTLGSTHGCLVIDSEDRVYLNTDTKYAVVIYNPAGEYQGSWGAELAGGLHGMCLEEEDGEELLYLAHVGLHEVLKTTLDGEILMRIPWPEESGLYADKSEYRPTSVAVGPAGDIFVADGYGAHWVHRFNAEGRWLSAFGGRGKEAGKLRTPHGMILDETEAGPTLLIADRGNQRLQRFGLDGESLEIIEGMFRRPCHMHKSGDELVVADLKGRVTILDKDQRLLVHLGENSRPEEAGANDVGRATWRDGEFISPHCARWDSQGNLYVADWLQEGRISKLRRIR